MHELLLHGFDEVHVGQQFTYSAGCSDEGWISQAEYALRRAGFQPRRLRSGNPNRARFDLGDMTLSVRGPLRRCGGGLCLLLPEPLHRCPEVTWRRAQTALSTLRSALNAEVDGEPEIESFSLHADYAGPRIAPCTEAALRSGLGVRIRPEKREGSGEFSGFTGWLGKSCVWRIYRKDWQIIDKPRAAWLQGLWPRTPVEPVWRNEIVFQPKLIRRSGVVTLDAGGVNECWRWALSNLLTWTRKRRGRQDRAPAPLWRAMGQLKFRPPWEASDADSPQVRGSRFRSTETVVRRMLAQGVAGAARAHAAWADCLPRAPRDAIHLEVDRFLDAEPERLDRFLEGVQRARRARGQPLLPQDTSVPFPDDGSVQ
jgi:hypothetical protein